MIQFEKYTLKNGLKVLVHTDDSTPMAAVNILYNVGARDESPDRTGFAHLFEHLMFSGSENVEDFDEPLQWAGGDSNAFTNCDITNYYDTVPAENIETVFWLESDRMKSLNFSQEALDVQRKVVVEEFKETCLNRPYGDVWHNMLGLAYKVHPYQWPTLGKTPQHVEDATLEDVKSFFKRFYCPNNAVLVVAGGVEFDDVVALAEEWFGDIEAGDVPVRNLPQEPKQTAYREKTVVAEVPLDSVYIAFHAPARMADNYYVVDLLSDVLSNGQSSRFYRRLLKEKQLFTDIDCYISGQLDPGLFIISAKPAPNVSFEQAEAAIWEELNILKTELVPEQELQKLKNKLESNLAFSEAGVLNKAMSLAFFEMLGDANMINDEGPNYQKVMPEDLIREANEIFTRENCSVLYYKAKNKEEAEVEN